MYKLTFSSLIVFLVTTESFAYLGPGIGGGVVAATIGIAVSILALLFGLIWFPLKKLIRKRKEKKEKQQNKID